MTEWRKLDRGIFLVNVLGIIHDKKENKILIGRRENDPYIPRLSWCFPGGMPAYETELEVYVKEQIKKQTDLDVDVKEVVFAKTYPEKREFLSIYYYCVPISTNARPGAELKRLMWIKPTEVSRYFTTSIHPFILSYLRKLEQAK